MKFSALGDRVVDPSALDQFVQPVKLNRKDPRTVRRLTEEDRERINKRTLAEAAGLDLMELDVKDEDGLDVKPTKKVREEIDLTLVGTGKSGLAPAMRTKSNMFKKKTKRVFVSSEEARRLKREEWMPWVLEDDDGNERWIGTLEGGAGEAGQANGASSATKRASADRNGTGMKGWRPEASTAESGGGGSSYVAFVFGDGGADFSIVPLHRWYKFNRGPKYATLGTDDAEKEYERAQKPQGGEEGRWMMHKRMTTASQKASAAAGGSTAGSSAAASPAPAPAPGKSAKSRKAVAVAPQPGANIRSRLLDKSVLSGRRTSSGTGGKLRAVDKGSRRGDGAEPDDDEFDYEADFQDDEEGIARVDDHADEEETKELEERIKKEMRAAKHFEAEPESDPEEVKKELTTTGKDVKRLVKKLDKNYESDGDSDNPYASETDSEDSASVASLDINDTADRSASGGSSLNRSSSQQGSRPSTSSRHHSGSRNPSRAGSRSGSPSGSAVVAMRATSPAGGRRSAPGSRSGSPAPGAKRKRPDDDTEDPKRRKNGSPGPSTPGDDEGLLTEADLVQLLKTKPVFTTKEVLSHFKKAFKAQPANKVLIGGLLKAVANFTDGSLQLKAGY